MILEQNVPLQPYNTFGIAARAEALVRVRSEDDLRAVLQDARLAHLPRTVLGGGSNVVLTGDVKGLVLKVEVPGLRLAGETDRHWIIEAGGGVVWHELVRWTLEQGWPGLENMALIPGTVGASPVQNIGAYGVELQDRFHALDAMDLFTGEVFTLNHAQCGFGYRDSVFKHASHGPEDLGLAGRAVILRVRLALPKKWKPELGYLDLERKMAETGNANPDARTIFDWVCAIRSAKLPDPAIIGNAGSFFQNPIVPDEQYQTLLLKHPDLISYADAAGKRKLAAGWLIDQCGLKGQRMGNVGVYQNQALVLVNYGNGTAKDILALAKCIQDKVHEKFGVSLQIEPNIL